MHLQQYINKLIFLRVRDKRWFEPFGVPTDLLSGKVSAVDTHGIWLHWNRFPLRDSKTGEQKRFKGDLFIPMSEIVMVFASEELQRDLAAQQEANRLANIEPAGES